MEDLQLINNGDEKEYNNIAHTIIDKININNISETLAKVNQFQQIIKTQLKDGIDYGIIPKTKKPTLLKAGAEKICMILGLTTEFEIIESNRNFEIGFFDYQIKCTIYKNGNLITQGLGSANTKESKYIKADSYTIDNTILKMAKKRALVDATLLVASLSEIFTQDVEDLDFTIDNFNLKKINTMQAKYLFKLANGNHLIVKEILDKYKIKKTTDILISQYIKICEEIKFKAGRLKDNA